MAGLSDEQQTALQFLARCCNLRLAAVTGQAAAAARMAALAALAAPPPLSQQLAQQQQQQGSAVQAESSTSSTMVVQELLGRLRHAVAAVGAPPEAAPTLEETLELLRKEGANGYGIMAPSASDVSKLAPLCVAGLAFEVHVVDEHMGGELACVCLM